MSLRPVDEFFLTSDFATPAVYKPVGGVSQNVNIIFDEAFAQIVVGQDEYESTKPLAHVRTDDFPIVTNGDTLKIGSTTYYIIQKEYDVLGVTRLLLSLDPP